MKLTYTEQNGLLIPDLVLDDQPPGSFGKYGRMRKRYLEQKHDGTFSALVLSGTLTPALTRQLAVAEGVTEELKSRDQIEWVRRMNYIRNRAEEMVLHEVVYGE